MKHSEYTQLTNHLDKVIANADTIRLVFSKVEVPADPATLEPGEPATRWVPADQAKEHPGFQFRYQMLNDLENTLKETEQMMDGFVDGWTDENQARADQGLGPTADVRKLYASMSGFLVVAENPIQGAKRLFLFVRNRCRQWINQANEWFPDLNNQDENQNQADTHNQVETSTSTVTIDRDKLAGLFKGEFLRVDPHSGHCPFNSFYGELLRRSPSFQTTTDWGRVGYQIMNSTHLDRIAKAHFKPFHRWFEFIGVPVPLESSPGAYKDKTDLTDLSAWL